MFTSRENHPENTIIEINNCKFGSSNFNYIFGPCGVESYNQMYKAAEFLSNSGCKILRGGAFKPRTSPYDFQGMGIEGLRILKDVGSLFNMAVVSEIVDTRDIEKSIEYLDMIQIGARNMHNFELLKEAGLYDKPILLKRGLTATIEEFINAAEYILYNGNEEVILCERGIRSFDKETRNVLDIMAVPVLKQKTHLPVIVDITHSTGRKDLLIHAARAAKAVGADGITGEVHPNPAEALSDSKQQMSFEEYVIFMEEFTNAKREIKISGI